MYGQTIHVYGYMYGILVADFYGKCIVNIADIDPMGWVKVRLNFTNKHLDET